MTNRAGSSGGTRRPWRPTALLQASAVLHVASLAGALVSPQRWPLAAGAVLGNHIVLALAGMWPRSRLLGHNLTQLPPAAEADAAVALTFDDGPDPEVTPRVLERLDAAGARATFFCIGRRAREHPDVVADIVARGHRLENHSFTHPNTFSLLGPGGLGREIDRTQKVLTELAGRSPVYFRAPAGIRSPWLEPLLARRGLTLVSWTRRGFDSVDRDPSRVSRRLLDGLAARDILLIHDGSMISGRDRAGTVLEILNRVLERLAAMGLGAVALPDKALRP